MANDHEIRIRLETLNEIGQAQPAPAEVHH